MCTGEYWCQAEIQKKVSLQCLTSHNYGKMEPLNLQFDFFPIFFTIATTAIKGFEFQTFTTVTSVYQLPLNYDCELYFQLQGNLKCNLRASTFTHFRPCLCL